ncbi:MAG: VacB/RNase II family 3'-5' exoribonuclease [Akkermansia sp.]|nr:VacB/RNase II family 3'-5' exoribonuclease [Akkermansia sp.]
MPLNEELLRDYLYSPAYTPSTPDEVAAALGIRSAQGRRELKTLVQQLCERGQLTRLSGNRYALRKPKDGALTGRIIRAKSGKLLFLPDEAGQREIEKLCPDREDAVIPVQEGRGRDAMDGDIVRASIRLQRRTPFRRGRSPRRAHDLSDCTLSARVEEVMARGHNVWIGSYVSDARYGSVAGDGKTSPARIRLAEPPPPDVLPFMTVVVEPLSRPIGKMEATGRIVEVLGWPEDANVQITTVMRKYELPERFPEAVLDEVRRLPDAVSEAECARRDDWRDRCVLTIDPETARDYDDAISLTREKNGWVLAVHIADVSHYVRPGSALDAEALRRGNSTYLPDRVLPMLPPKLCDGLCSLREGEDRLTRLCLMHINRSGKVFRAEFRDSVIRSRRRLTYAQALAVLEERGTTGDAECDAMLHEAHQLAALLRRRRFEAGALDLDMPELRLITDEHGTPVDVEFNESDIAHQLIEEFMLAANEAVAQALNGEALPALYRVHEAPDAAKLHSFALQLKSYGIPAGTLASREELNRVLEQIKGHADEQQLKVALLRCLMRARYSPKALGHFGLAKGDYCHFTSPIRRYADLVVHRAFSRLILGADQPPLPKPAALASVAEHISETERNSAAAENEAQQQMLTLYMQQQCEAEHPRVWQAVITACWAQGIAIELPQLNIKGFISAADFPDNAHWFYERHASRWSATDARVLSPGLALSVVPLRVDQATGFTDFKISER